MPSALDVDAPASLFQVRFSFNAGIAAVGIHVAAGVGSIEQCFEDRCVGHCGMRDGDFPYQLAALVHAGVEL